MAIFGKKSQDDNLQKKVEKLEKQNSTMRDALEFYANAKNWQGGHKYRDEDDATILTDSTESGITVDKGSKAYRALKICDSV